MILLKNFLKKYGFLLFCFATAALYLLIGSKSSPLYPMNDWVDVNCFFTMGKSLLHGEIPYVDLYEQKGPVLYFVYAIIALVSPNSFFGVYLLEVLTYGLFLYFSGLIAKLYLEDSFLVWLIVAVLGGLIPITYAFAHGASVEEMCLFMSAYGLYVALRAIKEGRTLTFREGFTCGIWASILLWIKYTMLGLYLGLAVFIIIWYLCWGFRWKELFKTIGAFFAGIGVITGVVFLFYLLVGALDDLFTVYFYNNIFLYPRELEETKLTTITRLLNNSLLINQAYTLLFLPGLLWAVVRAFKDIRPLLLLLLSFSGLALGTYWGGWGISYYGLVFAVFALFGLIGIGELLRLCKADWLLDWLRRKFPAAAAILAAIAVGTMLSVNMEHSKNVYLMEYTKEDMPQYQFAEIIKRYEDPSLLNYGFLDGGFYFAADVVPNCRFFCYLNVPAPEMFFVQHKYIEKGLVDFIVTRDRQLTDYHMDSSKYQLAAQSELYFEGKYRTYYLYQLIDLTAAG